MSLFFQLILPFCNTLLSGVEDDPRLSFYSKVERWSNEYAMSIGLGGSYGHNFNSILIPELVHFDFVAIHDGVRGGSDGAIWRRWKKDSVN